MVSAPTHGTNEIRRNASCECPISALQVAVGSICEGLPLFTSLATMRQIRADMNKPSNGVSSKALELVHNVEDTFIVDLQIPESELSFGAVRIGHPGFGLRT